MPVPTRGTVPTRVAPAVRQRAHTPQRSVRSGGTKAQAANAVVNSMGTIVHLNYTASPYYTNYTGVKAALQSIGLRHIRDEWPATTTTQTRISDLGAAGIDLNCIIQTDNGFPSMATQLTALHALQLSQPGCIASIEGVNEPNEPLSHYDVGLGLTTPWTYKTVGYPAGVPTFISDLHAAVKADSVLASIPIMSPANDLNMDLSQLGTVLPPSQTVPFVDVGVGHPYCQNGNAYWGNTVGVNIGYGGIPFTGGNGYWRWANHPGVIYGDSVGGNMIDQYWRRSFASKPFWITESGWPVVANQGGVSLSVQAKYIPRLFLENYSQGVARTFQYALVDVNSSGVYSPTDTQANWGLLNNNLSLKPSGTALKNLIGLLSDPGASFTTTSLNYILQVGTNGMYTRTQDVHRLLMQKRDGSFWLALWHEVSAGDWSYTPTRELTPLPMPVTVTFASAPTSVAVYCPNDGSGPTDAYSVSGTATFSRPVTVSLSIPDKVVLLAIVP